MEFAVSAPAALEKVKEIPDPSLILILSDINMPGMTGLEMLPTGDEGKPRFRLSDAIRVSCGVRFEGAFQQFGALLLFSFAGTRVPSVRN